MEILYFEPMAEKLSKFSKNKTRTSNSNFASSNAIHTTSNLSMFRFSCFAFQKHFFDFVDVNSEFDSSAKTAIAKKYRKHLQTLKTDI